MRIEGKKLIIAKEGGIKKFLKTVQHITFSGEYALSEGQEIMYVTERAVFRLTRDGLELTEYAPGIDLEKDVLRLMEFKPIVRSPEEMDSGLFREV